MSLLRMLNPDVGSGGMRDDAALPVGTDVCIVPNAARAAAA
jgi:hypothetical protein